MKSFYLENEEILQKVMSQVFAKSEHDIYTKTALEEWFYLILDLKPDLLMIDADSLQTSIEGGWEQVFSAQIPVLIIRSASSNISESVLNHQLVCKILCKPLAPFEFLRTIENIFVSQ
jgi:DNA-binding response OmpR family regulator